MSAASITAALKRRSSSGSDMREASLSVTMIFLSSPVRYTLSTRGAVRPVGIPLASRSAVISIRFLISSSATTAVTDTGVCMTVRSGTTDFAVVQAASAALRHPSSPDQRS